MKNNVKFLIIIIALPQAIFCAQGIQKESDEHGRLMVNAAGSAVAPNPAHKANQVSILSLEGFDLSKVSNEYGLYETTKRYLTELIENEIQRLNAKPLDAIAKIIEANAQALKTSETHFKEFKQKYAHIMKYTQQDTQSNEQVIRGIFAVQIQDAVDDLLKKYNISDTCSVQ